MLGFFIKTKKRNLLTIIGLLAFNSVYTLFMSYFIKESTSTITVYFFMMLFWFLLLLSTGFITAVYIGDMIFEKYWKKENFLYEILTEQEILERKEFKDSKIKFRIMLVILVGLNIFIFNSLGGNVFDFYNRVGLHFSQLNYDNIDKQIESVKGLYFVTDEKYFEDISNRLKRLAKETKSADLRSWIAFYFKEKGYLEDIPFLIELASDENPEVVGEAVSGIYFTYSRKFKTEDEKIANDMYNEKFEFADLIKKHCTRVGYPKECILTAAYFDGKELFKIIEQNKDKKELYQLFILVLTNSSKEVVEPLLIHFYNNGSFDDKCLIATAFGKIQSLEGEKILIKDFNEHKKKECPTIRIKNKMEEGHLIGKNALWGVKSLESIEKIENLSFETRKFVYDLSIDKKENFLVRSKAGEVYEKLEYKFKNKK